MQTTYDPVAFNEESLDLEKIIKKYIRFWPWILSGLIIALVVGHFLVERKPRVYENRLTLLIHESSEPLLNLGGQTSITSGFKYGGSQINNQIEILTSRTLTQNTLKSLDFGIEYYRLGSFSNQEVYPNPYFTIEMDSLWPQSVNVPFTVIRSDDNKWRITADWENASLYSYARQSFTGQASDKDIDMIVKPGQWIETTSFRFRIRENPENILPSGQEFIFVFRDLNTLTRKFSGLRAQSVDNTSIVRLSMRSGSTKKNERFLNLHAQNFLNRELEKKNERAQKTIDFIEEQLEIVSQSLMVSETTLDTYRSTEQIINFDFEAQRVFSRMEGYQKQKAELLAREKYYQYLQNYLTQSGEDGSDLVPPSSLGVSDPLLSTIIDELIKLYTQRSELLINYKEDNPILNNVNLRIINAKNTALESLKNVISQNNVAIEDVDEQIETISAKISTLPESQRNLFTMERQFQLYNELFVFLQNKKVELEITKSGFTPIHDIVDPSLAAEGSLISPQRKRTLTIAGFMGLAIPIFLLFLNDFFNNKVRSSEDLEKLKLFPYIGIISRNNQKDNQIVPYDKYSVLAESFRSLRTNVQFLLPHGKKPVIMVTSTLLEEGKTFISLNLAAGFANMGKKVLILSFDLRKPKLHKYLDTELPKGLTNYLISDIQPREIIHKSSIKDLDIIFSGQVPPNPAELIGSPKVKELFDFAEKEYDYVIVDTPPVGMVSDGLLLVEHCNSIIYVVRHNKTPLKYLQHTLKGMKEKEIHNINILLNDVPPPGKFSNYSEYTYQYSYYDSKSKKT
ncbi:MAG: polysaccharide biosynthesis tyrosine autokinase [Bacteroidota bacterium]